MASAVLYQSFNARQLVPPGDLAELPSPRAFQTCKWMHPADALLAISLFLAVIKQGWNVRNEDSRPQRSREAAATAEVALAAARSRSPWPRLGS